MKISTLSRLVLNSVNGGVPFLMGAPGTAKTSVARKLAKDLGLRLFDLRLSTMDETNLGEFPFLSDRENNQKGKVVDFAIPAWAEESNKQPSLIFLDELNRTPQNVLNASLKLFLEREIGTNFEFNNTVYFITAGNLGAEDGTNVDELDSAVVGRLLPIKWELPMKQWVKDFALKNVHPIILKFLKSNSEWYYKASDEGGAYANPRSWTFLSNFIGFDNPSLEDIKSDILEVGKSFVGDAATPFDYYIAEEIENQNKLSIEAVINNFDEIEGLLKTIGSVKHTEIMNHASLELIEEFTAKQLKNFRKFVNLVNDEVKSIVLSKIYIKLISSNEILDEGKLKVFLPIFKDHKVLSDNIANANLINK